MPEETASPEKSEDPAEDDDDEEVFYEPTNVSDFGLRVETPPSEWGWDRPDEEIQAERMEKYRAIKEEDKVDEHKSRTKIKQVRMKSLKQEK